VTPAGAEQVGEQGDDSTEQADVETPLAPPITSRFLFVNVAGKRATQLARGAKPRVEVIDGRRYAARLAMEEVRRGLVPYELVA
jgi:DNA-directed RNA polymerase subunit K/omega